jgi:hypothetical protein
MKPNELRINNYVLDTFGECLKIEQRHFTILDFDSCKPIPLTEQWLKDFGFEKRMENDGNLPCFKKGKYTIAMWIGKKWQFWINTVDIYRSPQHVHQLQNLYFALTGEELKLNQSL